MKYIKYGSNPTVAILINNNSLDKNQIENVYVAQGNLVNSIVAFGLDYGSSSKPSASLRKEYLAKIIPVINKLGITHILCCDAEYFKTLAGQVKAVPFLGSLLPSKIENYEHILVTYCPSYKTLFRAPDTIKNIQLATNSINTSLTGSYQPLGTNIIHYESYPESILDIENTLNSLHQYDALTCDIETFSLKFYDAGIVSIAFAWNQHEGIAFHCDDLLTKKQNKAVRLLLFNFFINYKGKLIFHNISYDATVLIYQLWMNSLIDQEGLLNGLECMNNNFDCTKVISYLATNSCARVKTGLKDQAFEFAGNWAEEEIKNIAIMEPAKILKYNLADTLATWFTYNKNHPVMLKDNQEDIYINLMKPAIIDIIQMQLTGFCLDMPKVLEVEKQLSDSHSQLYNTLCKLHIVNTFISDEIQQEVIKRNANYKKKVIDASEAKFVFNPNSNIQIAKVLYEYLNLPVLDYTKKGNPAVGAKTLKKLSDITTDTEVKTFLTSLIDYTQVGKILSSFIPAFKAAPLAPDGYHYLFGSFNLGGTVSGRLSSCVVGDTMVHCAEGTKRIDTLSKNDLVLTHTGDIQPILNVFNNGLQPVYYVETKEGKSVTCTSSHRLLTTKGFLSLEDMFSESESKIRQRITNRNANSISGLPELTISPAKNNVTWEEFTYSTSVPLFSFTCREYQKKNFCKGTTTEATLQRSPTKRTYFVHREYFYRHRKSCQTNQSASYSIEPVYKTGTWGRAIQQDFSIKKVLSKNFENTSDTSSFSENTCRKVCRPSWLYSSTYTMLDGEREQIQFRASSGYVTSNRATCFTYGLGSASYQRGQNRQQNRELSFNDPARTHITSSKTYSPIVKINYVGIRRVYDLEIETDHSYIANGIFVHNCNPNLQNIPSGSTYGKLIKECFIAPKGWLFCGADSASLEDRIDTLLTKDPNKIKVYSEGYDGHSLRAYYYFNDQLTNIPDTVEGINSIKDLFPHLRQDSKAPTFALTYQGTAYTLVKNCGFTQELAEQIEKNYHELYKISDQWKQDKIQQASLDGYVDVAFGLKVRCPVLPQVILGNKYTPKEAAAESRTVGNALGQSYGLLNSRASMAIMRTVRASEFRLDIKLCAQIHDAIYFRVKNNIKAIHFLNELISKEMSWQELPELQHPDVTLYGELDIFTPNWSKAITLPNNITKKEILTIAGK